MRTPDWRRDGADPDYRFSLANERTFLAWIRTALALLAGGVLLHQFATKMTPRAAVSILALALAGSAALLSVMAYWRWRANEIAMRHSRSLPGTLTVPLLASAAFVISAGILLLIVLPA